MRILEEHVGPYNISVLWQDGDAVERVRLILPGRELRPADIPAVHPDVVTHIYQLDTIARQLRHAVPHLR